MRLTYGKLVRDKIPQIIQEQGGTPSVRILDDQNYRAALLAKLAEEAHEAAAAPEQEVLAELADVYEVLHALLNQYGTDWPGLTSLADAKRAARGGFENRVYLEHVDQDDDSDT